VTTPLENISKLCLLPELKLIQVIPPGFFVCEKISNAEVCPSCANLSQSIYDHRWVLIRDAPIRDKAITFKILKRRFWCKLCAKTFTEPVPGILPGRRTTQRFRLAVMKIEPVPTCPCCGDMMSDSGMTEDSEQLTVIPKKYEIIRQRRAKYRCACQGAIVTSPSPARIVPGSTYSDEMIADVALSKFCDLIPIQRYVVMADRAGIFELPANSLIDTTHAYADFVSGAYRLLKTRVMSHTHLSADETPHRMLEGSSKKNWFLWGFSTPDTCYLECRDTRSGDVASQFLTQSQCEVLISDVYSGYRKAIREANVIRSTEGRPQIRNAYCNAHARRYFFKAYPQYPEAQFYLDHYHEIYRTEASVQGKPPPIILEARAQMRDRFELMKAKALEELPSYPRNGKYGKALRYLIEHFEGLTLFLEDAKVPIDNNRQERLLRSHVVGRKCWYGTHSEQGALTAAILFSLVETCKLNQVNPREYFKHLTEDLLSGSKPYTPIDFKIRS